MTSFWNGLKRPFFVLAPMADVTDPAYRRIIAQLGKPAVTWTEFVSADGLYHTIEKGRKPINENPLVRDLQYSEAERPIVAQLFSSKPEMMHYASKLCAELGFDGIDINMGCPVGTIVEQGCGAAMIRTPDIAKEIIRAAREGAPRLPISVKTRLGYSTNEIETWLPILLEQNLPALTVHLRTRKEMSAVPAHWEHMSRIVELKNQISPSTLIIGNGDVKDLDEAKQKAEETGADGIMLGRAIFGNPWVFAGRKPEDTPIAERLAALVLLARGFEELRPQKSFHILKKHIKAFVTGFDGAAELRAKLMETETAEALAGVIAETKAASG